MSTLRVNTLQNTSTTDGGISIDTSGHVTVDGVAMPSSGPLSNRNLVINGAMQVAQRGTSQTGVSDGATEAFSTLDRFRTRFSGGHSGVVTNSQSTTVPAGEGFSNSFGLDVTTAVASLTGSMRSEIQYKVEAQDLRNSGWNYTDTNSSITLSFWARSSKTGAHCVHLIADDTTTDKYYLAEYSLTANTWERISITIPGHANAVVNNDNGKGLEINWILSAGPDIDGGTSGAWHSTTQRATSNQVNVYDSTDGEFYLTGVQLEVGSVATPFEHRSYGDELARCQRYFQATSSVAGTAIANGQVSSSTAAQIFIKFITTMRAAPSFSVNNGGNFRVSNATDSGIPNVTALSLSSSNEEQARLSATSSGLSAGNACLLINSNQSGTLGIVSFSAEL
jgi:hypothetical protein